ncbi:MAG TPA: PP0621 family protein [Ramlibacter sp.]|jgi:uncharacterized protein|nr:PP0621 family protein [Ramlibacter sp.]
MKYLVLIAVVVIVYMVWRSSRLRDEGSKPRNQAAAPGEPQEMVSCPVCGLHLPRPDAVAGSNGRFYCTPEHRARAGV